MPTFHLTANCIIIAQFPIENHSEQGRFAELPPKTIGKVHILGDYYAIRSTVLSPSVSYRHGWSSGRCKSHRVCSCTSKRREEKTAGEYIQTVLLSIPIGRTFRACLGKLIHSDRFVATRLYLVLLVVVSCCAVVRMN